jgi:site-specific DNA-methyltransferase (cytosine-N4-specific)
MSYAIKKGGYYCLIVGKNRSRIGNKDTIIDTPHYLSIIAESVGYSVKGMIPLETYQRYDVHLKNSIDKETLIILRKPNE